MPAGLQLFRADGSIQLDLTSRVTKNASHAIIPAAGTTITDPMFQEGDPWCMVLPTQNPELETVGKRPLVTIYKKTDPGGARIVIGASDVDSPVMATWGIY